MSFPNPRGKTQRRRTGARSPTSSLALDETGELLIVAPEYVPKQRRSTRFRIAGRRGSAATSSSWEEPEFIRGKLRPHSPLQSEDRNALKSDGSGAVASADEDDASTTSSVKSGGSGRVAVTLGSGSEAVPKKKRSRWGILRSISKASRPPNAGAGRNAPSDADSDAIRRSKSAPAYTASSRSSMAETTSKRKIARMFSRFVPVKDAGGDEEDAGASAVSGEGDDGLANISARRRARLARSLRQRNSVFGSAAASAAAEASTAVGEERKVSTSPVLRLSVGEDGQLTHNLGVSSPADRKGRIFGRLGRRLSIGLQDFARDVRKGELQISSDARGGIINVRTDTGLLSPSSARAQTLEKEKGLRAERDDMLADRLGFKPKMFSLTVRVEHSGESLGLELRPRIGGSTIMVAPSIFYGPNAAAASKQSNHVVGAGGAVEVVAVHSGLLMQQHGPECVQVREREKEREKERDCVCVCLCV